MSSVAVTDKRGGVFQVMINFNYGECDRLPYNSMRKVKARIEQVPHGGIKATAEFNIRNPRDAENFVEVLDLFGTDGSFVHGSSADPDHLDLETPPEDDDSSGRSAATTVKAPKAAAGAAKAESSPGIDSASEPEDLETEEETTLETEDEPELEIEEDEKA